MNHSKLLDEAIEDLIRAHIESCMVQAQHAIQRAFSSFNASRPKKSLSSTGIQSVRRKHRTAEEHNDIKHKLYAIMCSHPGQSMRFLAEALGMEQRHIEKSMRQLRDEHQVKTTGKYQKMRYFPIGIHVDK